MNHNPALPYGRAGFFCSIGNIQKKVSKNITVFADSGKFFYASFNRSIIFLIESLKFLSL